MKDFKIKSFKVLLNERKSKPCAKVKSEETKTAVAEMPKHKWLGIDELDNYKCGDTAVYIQDINGNFWNVSDWDDSVEPNAIAVITPKHKFRIALTDKYLPMHSDRNFFSDEKLKFLMFLDSACLDCDGVHNTQQILKLQPCEEYAAGYCNAYTFPDGTTKGHLPSLGELYLAWQNKSAIDAALVKCGGAALSSDYHWSSTLDGSNTYGYRCWNLVWDDGSVSSDCLDIDYYARPFAALEF